MRKVLIVIFLLYLLTMLTSCLIKPVVLTLSAIPQGGGTVAGTGVYLKGDYITITADATECFMFIGWYDLENDSLVSLDREYAFAIQKSQNLAAKFEKAFLEVDFLLLGSNIVGCKYDVKIKVNGRVTKIDFQDRDEISFPKSEVFPDETGWIRFSEFYTNPGVEETTILAYAGNTRVSYCTFSIEQKP